MSDVKTIKQGFIRSAVFMGMVGVILAIDTLTGDALTKWFGVRPRNLWGLDGILFSPLLHGGLAHYFSNLLPMIVLGGLLFANPNYKPWRSLLLIWLFSGAGTWIIGGSGTNHIGASGVVFGLVTFLITAAILLRSWRSAIISIAVFFMYGGVLFGALPPLLNSEMESHISWECHLSGAIGGVIAAWRVRSR